MNSSFRKTRLIQDTREAGELLARGMLVAFPTETVYGLGGAIDQPGAVEGIFAAKGRPADNPLIVHLVERSVLEKVVLAIPPMAQELMDHFWPGPLTLVFKKQAWVSSLVTAGLDSVAVRSPANPIAREILLECKCPVAAPSANRSGRPSATTWQSVLEDLNGKVDAIFQGESCAVGIESTVVDCTGSQPELLRAGAVTLEQLRSVRPDTVVLKRTHAAVNSPGLRHKHYQPQAKVFLVNDVSRIEPKKAAGMIGMTPHASAAEFGLYVQVSEIERYASQLYEFFREADRKQLAEIYCEGVPTIGLGAALMDRLSRAAES